MKVLFVTHELAYRGAARQLMLLAAGLPRENFQVRVFTTSADTAWSRALRDRGVTVDSGQKRRLFDLRSFLALRKQVPDFRPDVIHAFGVPALRALALVGGRAGAHVILSAAFSGDRVTPAGRLDRWLIRTMVDRVIVRGPAQAEQYRHLGIPAAKLSAVPSGVPLAAPPKLSHPEWCRAHGLPENASVIACVGPLEPAKGFRDAIWAFDILQFLYADLHLLLIGAGPQEGRLREFVEITRTTARVHFLGERDDRDELLAHSEVVWVPSHADRGSMAALEAMASGRPVVASRWPGLSEIIAENETGVLIPAGDKAALARTRALLDDPERRLRLGESARQRVTEQFSVEAMVRGYQAIYAANRSDR